MKRERRSGSVLVAVLWCLALMFVVAIGVLHTAATDLRVSKHYDDRIQARYLALAGIEKAKALIYQDARERSRNRKSHTLDVYRAEGEFRNIRLGRGHFSVFRPGSVDEGGGVVYGVSDEESRLNINHAPPEELTNLFAITPDVVAAIVDWRDEDNTVSPGGAELEHYASLRPPRRPRNGPLETVRELLMVRGVTGDLLLGHDTPQAPMFEAPDSPVTAPSQSGWAAMLTVHSSVDNVSAAGTQRVNIQTADEAALSTVPGISPELAKAIVRYRAQRRFESVFDLLDVAALQDGGEAGSRGVVQSRGQSTGASPGPESPSTAAQGNQSNATGPKLISPALLMDVADDVTVQSNEELPGVINVNSASLETLMCLPGVTRELAQAIISFRQSNGFLPNAAHLLQIPGFTQESLKRIAPRISTRSETYRIRSEGRIASTGARQVVEEVVHIGLNEVQSLEYRENDL